jgi:hypothetical protein
VELIAPTKNNNPLTSVARGQCVHKLSPYALVFWQGYRHFLGCADFNVLCGVIEEMLCL